MQTDGGGNRIEELNNKGKELLDQGRYDDAIARFEEALSYDVRSADAWDGKGTALLGLGATRYDDALACFEKALKIDPTHVTAWQNKGVFLTIVNSQYEDALSCFQRALDVQPSNVEVLINKANALDALGRRQEAVLVCNEALKINPHNPSIWFTKALAEDAELQYLDAVRSYDRFLSLQPSQGSRQEVHARQRLDHLIARDALVSFMDKFRALVVTKDSKGMLDFVQEYREVAERALKRMQVKERPDEILHQFLAKCLAIIEKK